MHNILSVYISLECEELPIKHQDESCEIRDTHNQLFCWNSQRRKDIKIEQSVSKVILNVQNIIYELDF